MVKFVHKTSETAELVSRLRRERKVLKAAARHFREEASARAHEIALLRAARQPPPGKAQGQQWGQLGHGAGEEWGAPSLASDLVRAERSGLEWGEGSGGQDEMSPEALRELWASRVMGFYQAHCPPKADFQSCADTADKFRGREGDLFAALYHKYKVAEKGRVFHMAK